MTDGPASPLLVLILNPDNPCNTTITNRDTDEVLYTVRTVHTKKASTTYITNGDDEHIASYVWHDVRSDVITLGSMKPVTSSAWLKKSVIPFKDTVTFTDFRGNDFKWKGNAPGQHLELYSKTDKKNPICQFKKHYRFTDRSTDPPTEIDEPATLTFTQRGQDIQDLAVISFLLLEKTRRLSENNTSSMLSATAIPPKI